MRNLSTKHADFAYSLNMISFHGQWHMLLIDQ
jgi:hypothetical protein